MKAKYKLIIILSVILAIPVTYGFVYLNDCYLTPTITSRMMTQSVDDYWKSYDIFQNTSDNVCDVENGDNLINDPDCKFSSFKNLGRCRR